MKRDVSSILREFIGRLGVFTLFVALLFGASELMAQPRSQLAKKRCRFDFFGVGPTPIPALELRGVGGHAGKASLERFLSGPIKSDRPTYLPIRVGTASENERSVRVKVFDQTLSDALERLSKLTKAEGSGVANLYLPIVKEASNHLAANNVPHRIYFERGEFMIEITPSKTSSLGRLAKAMHERMGGYRLVYSPRTLLDFALVAGTIWPNVERRERGQVLVSHSVIRSLSPADPALGHELLHVFHRMLRARGINLATHGFASPLPGGKYPGRGKEYTSHLSFDELTTFQYTLMMQAKQMIKRITKGDLSPETWNAEVATLHDYVALSREVAARINGMTTILNRIFKEPEAIGEESLAAERKRMYADLKKLRVKEFAVKYGKTDESLGADIFIQGTTPNVKFRVHLPLVKSTALDDPKNYELARAQADLLQATAQDRSRIFEYAFELAEKLSSAKTEAARIRLLTKLRTVTQPTALPGEPRYRPFRLPRS